MKFRSIPLLLSAVAVAAALTACVKMPKAKGTAPGGPDGPEEPISPPRRRRNTSIRSGMSLAV